ncbi:hypothetical protein PQQ81_26935 [Paraburkholderia strydomiana]|uniref:hypothetical protein n=1 Tax=Paraburkholderia strydomiana TaxID=1245417 RepID=UPI0038B7BB0D
MSIRVMTLVSDRFSGGGSDLIAMLMLADWCSDDGDSLYPSIAILAARMRVSESQARRVLHGLIDRGFVAVIGNEFGGAPGTTRAYRLNVAKLRSLPILPKIAEHQARSSKRIHVGSDSFQFDGDTAGMDATPSTDATPSSRAAPSMDARDGVHGCAGGLAPMRETASMGDTLSTMNRQLTIKEPSERRGKAKSPTGDDVRSRALGVVELVAEGVDREHAIDWLAVRRRKRMPLTPSVWEKTKREAAKAGLTPAQVVQRCAETSWGGFEASYVENARSAPSANPPQRFDAVEYVNNRNHPNEHTDILIDV